ncbi:MAG: heparan-alpha-glucosaminide N-acetyltransferase domain-containing protein [Planctomycetota bacterium]
MRYLSIDYLRAIAIVMMASVHFVENLAGIYDNYLLPTGLAAPMFTMLTGVSYQIWLRSQRSKGVDQKRVTQRSVRRGLFLVGLGFAFNIFVWMPEDVYNWDVLTFIGVAFLLLAMIRDLPPPLFLLIAGLSWLMAPVLRAEAGYASYWTNGFYHADMTMSEFWIGFLVCGYFPLFPWIIYPVIGFLVAEKIFPAKAETPSQRRLVASCGLTLIGLSIIARLLQPYASTQLQTIFLNGWTMFPPSLIYQLGTLGVALTALSLLPLLTDRPQTDPQSWHAQWAKTFSSHSLTIYLLHHVVHLWPLWIWGSIVGDDATAYWQQATSKPIAALIGLIFLIVCYLGLRWWERRNWPTIESWMRWLCD